MFDDIKELLPEGVRVEELDEYDLYLIQGVLETVTGRIDDLIEKVESHLGDVKRHPFLNSKHEIVVPSAVVRSWQYVEGDELDVSVRNGALYIKPKEKEWDCPDWLNEE